LKIGKPLNIKYAYHYTGVDPQTGQYTFLDKNHDGIISLTYNPADGPTDDRYIVSLAPKFFGGLGMDFKFGNLVISAFFNIKDQIGENAFLNISAPPGTANFNQPASIFGKQWQYPGDKADIEKFFPNAQEYYIFQQSDGVYTDASFIRLSNLSVSYSLPAGYLKKAGVQGCNLFFHTNNLFIITKYKGLDPEIQTFGTLPPTKTIVGGINLNF